MFQLKSLFKPTKDQQKAVAALSDGISHGHTDQVLLGVTGSGKTYTVAQVIQKTQLPTLVLAHNKTLAGQLYQEMKEFFPENAVSYFVSYYDYYQPEAYLPSTDTYIEKEATINEFIDRLRLQSTSNILSRDDVIVVASVSCIYNIGSPVEYQKFVIHLIPGQTHEMRDLTQQLVALQYEKSEFDFKRGTFRTRANTLDLYPAAQDYGVRLSFTPDLVLEKIITFEPLSGKSIEELPEFILYSAKQYMVDPSVFASAEARIRHDLKTEAQELQKRGKELEAQRLIKRVNFDLEMVKEVGYVNGIENYSRYFDGRKPGDPPHTLLDYFRHRFGDQWLMVIDESHMTIPQLRGMQHGDYSRKKMLVEYGFRLKASFDNRPLTIYEFLAQVPRTLFVSATPSQWEVDRAQGHVVEQLVRPTGIVDPQISVRPADTEIQDLIQEIQKEIMGNKRILVSAITKRIAEDLTAYLKEKGIKAEYLHSDIKTLERTDILNKLRKQEYDVLVGINLLREGIDLPEVSLVAILDADKEGFLRNKTSLIQTMGRAARNVSGRVILYADKATDSIKAAITEVDRRRAYQVAYNKKHGITAKTITKAIRDDILGVERESIDFETNLQKKQIEQVDLSSLTPYDRKRLVTKLERDMREQARDLNFESAIYLRDKIVEIKKF